MGQSVLGLSVRSWLGLPMRKRRIFSMVASWYSWDHLYPERERKGGRGRGSQRKREGRRKRSEERWKEKVIEKEGEQK